MKEEYFKNEIIQTLEIVAYHLRNSKEDYDLVDFKFLLDESIDGYEKYLNFVKNKKFAESTKEKVYND